MHLNTTHTDVPSQEDLPDSDLPAVSKSFLHNQSEGTKKEHSKDKDKDPSDDPSLSSPPSPGDVVMGKAVLSVKQYCAPCLMVRLGEGVMGRVCVSELGEESEWRRDPLAK